MLKGKTLHIPAQMITLFQDLGWSRVEIDRAKWSAQEAETFRRLKKDTHEILERYVNIPVSPNEEAHDDRLGRCSIPGSIFFSRLTQGSMMADVSPMPPGSMSRSSKRKSLISFAGCEYLVSIHSSFV